MNLWPRTVLDLAVDQLTIFVLQLHAHSAGVGPVLGVQLFGLQSRVQAEHLDRIHNVSGKRIFHCELRADLAALGAGAGLIKVHGVQALEVLGDLALWFRSGHRRHGHLLGLRRRGGLGWDVGGGDDGIAGEIIIGVESGGDLLRVGVRDFLDLGVMRHGCGMEGMSGEACGQVAAEWAECVCGRWGHCPVGALQR